MTDHQVSRSAGGGLERRDGTAREAAFGRRAGQSHDELGVLGSQVRTMPQPIRNLDNVEKIMFSAIRS